MNNKILITGATGLLGKALVEQANDKKHVSGTYWGDYHLSEDDHASYYKLDIRDAAGYERLFRQIQPEVVVHTASIGNPDFAEKNQELTWDVNVSGTRNILKLCEEFGSRMIYVSSNGIYDGDRAPYGESDAANPINYYGRTKKAGEDLVKRSDVPSVIVRPILMYGNNHSFERDNIVNMAIKKLSHGEIFQAYDDVYSNALLSDACAECILTIIHRGLSGEFNIAGGERVSIYGLLLKTAEVFGLDRALLSPVKQGFFNDLVPRPKDTSYRTEKMEKVLGIRPLKLGEGLKLVKESMRWSP